MKLGIACAWSDPPEKTWSYVPWSLKASLSDMVDVADVGSNLPGYFSRVFKALNLRYSNGSLTSNWQYSGMMDLYNRVSMERKIRHSNIDAIIQIGDPAKFRLPYYHYQDLSYRMVRDYSELSCLSFPGLDLKTMEKRIERQSMIYRSAKGIFAMSRWFADHLVNTCGIPAHKVHVVHAGSNSKAFGDISMESSYGKRKSLIFLGGDFYRKGGDLVVKAVQKLRKEADPEISLTVAGPETWPMEGEIPEGISFLGQVPRDRLHVVLKKHGIMVMPSRFEAFGIAFVDALCNGIPCIGRDAFAMPEIIRPGFNGQLISKDDTGELAASIWKTINSEEIFKNTWHDRERTREYFSWKRVSRDMLDIIRSA